MTRTVSTAALVVALAAALAVSGCGEGSGPGAPSAQGLPLAGGARVVADVRSCDAGAHPYCVRELVLVAPRGADAGSPALLRAQQRRLRRAGWTVSKGDTDFETAAESPDGRRRVVFATAAHELQSIDEGRIARSRPVARALSASMFARAAALSMVVETGSA